MTSCTNQTRYLKLQLSSVSTVLFVVKTENTMTTDYISYGYAAIVAFGGVMGYVKAGSLMSLTMGLLFGSLAGYGALKTSANPGNIRLALGASGILASIMGYRFFKYGKFKLMPAGLVFILSVLQVGRLLYKSRN